MLVEDVLDVVATVLIEQLVHFEDVVAGVDELCTVVVVVVEDVRLETVVEEDFVLTDV